MNSLNLTKELKLDDGRGFVFKTLDDFVVLSADKRKKDESGLRLRKIGVSLCSGCGVKCIYCFTNGFKCFRPLSVDEIIDQVDLVNGMPNDERYHVTKVSFKQMGDPLLNPENTIKSIKALRDKYPEYNFVVSTVGLDIGDKTRQFFSGLNDLDADIRLQFSCHTTSDEERKRLSPNLPLLSLEDISRIVNSSCKRLTTLNFVMIDGFEYDVTKLVKLFKKGKIFVKINYLDKNKWIENFGFKDMSKDKVATFVQSLKYNGIPFAYRGMEV